jgi:hypothetical protein
VCSTCSPAKQKEYGCNAKQDENGVWIDKSLIPITLDGVDTWQCPRRPVKDDPAYFGELMGLYNLYAEGVLADEGAIMSQATKYVTLMRLVHSTVNECEAQKLEDAKNRRT